MRNRLHHVVISLGLAIVASTGTAVGCARAQAVRGASPAAKPALVVLVTVDQLRPDYLTRFGAQLTGGLRYLTTEGVYFENGFQDHAITETAPGHASILSGRFPVRTGIMMNSQGVNDVPNAQVIGGRPTESASPERFRGTTLVDWLRAVNPATRWLSVSRKDRGAILPVGRSKGDVYWYYGTGLFTTSRYYADSLPTWVRDFNSRLLPWQYAGKSWTLLLPASEYAEPDSVGIEAFGTSASIAFPHVVPKDEGDAAAVLPNYPFMDELTLQFALHGVRSLALGADGARTDLLAVSLSTTDAVGHRFGPDSRELHDQVLRLDRSLGAFMDSLRALRGPDRVLFVLTSDHGVTPHPMFRSPRDPNGDAKRVTLEGPWRTFLRRLTAMGIDTDAVEIDDGIVVVTNPNAFSRARANVDVLLRDLAQDFLRVQGVLRADLMTDLARADTVRDAIARRWLHMFPVQSNVRLIATLTPYSYWLPVNYATHGSPHDLDARVPIAFAGAGIVPGVVRDTVRVVDIAPTLAAILGVRPLEPLDGRVLTRVVR